jgi:hypothetical protein
MSLIHTCELNGGNPEQTVLQQERMDLASFRQEQACPLLCSAKQMNLCVAA